MAKVWKYKNKRTNENMYAFKVYLGTDPVTGKRKETTRRGFRTKSEAKQTASILVIKYKNGEYTKNDYNIKTFDELFNIWFESYKNTVKHSTATDTWWYYKRYIKPRFKNVRVNKINVAFCQRNVNHWHEHYRNYRRIKNLAAQIIDYAITLELIDSNPMKKIILPKPKPKKEKKNFYEKDELKYFFDCLEDIGDKRYIAFFRLLAYTGIRRGEAMGLKWSDFNFDNQTMSIKRGLYFDERIKKVIVQTPKTKSSIRTLDVDQETIQILKALRADQQQRFLKFGVNTLKAGQYVFTQDKSNKLLAPGRADDWLRWIYKHYPQRKITVHGFRHTHASLLFEAGATIKQVQDRLGHSNSKTTLDIYTHVTKKAKHDTAKKFANFMRS
ncbi:MAG: tyrosine-type recombinase/integrase [Liquorilactobacillus nagelii]|uniref:site-specific integrase n=1 Tax=Liquorilactobacillus ghanensis TaxID=399370 RepID=UPI0039EB88D3